MTSFMISEENWDLHRKGHQDQERHMGKVKEAIKSNLPDLISEESIIQSNGRQMTKIPIRSLDQYKIRYNYDKTQRVGQGDGKTKVGDVLGRLPSKSGDKSDKGSKAGDRPGIDYYEADVSLMEIEELFFKELELPDLLSKNEYDLQQDTIDYRDIRKQGLMGNVDKKRTILTAIKRNAMEGKASITPFKQEDLRFKTWEDIKKPESRAVVLALMDTSGSMGIWEKYVARSFYFWMTRFLKTRYESVDIEYIAHHTEAKVVTEDEFFKRGESGGTICSSAYRKALELIDDHYPPSLYNIYPFHFSDGDNLTSDNNTCVDLVNELMNISNVVGYGEINPYNRKSTLMDVYQKIGDDKFRYFILKEKRDVYYAMKYFFAKVKKENVS